MKLEDIINDRLKVLYRRLKKAEKILASNKNRLEESYNNIELLNLFLEDSTYEENLRNADTSYVTDLLQRYHYIEDTSVESELRTIKLLLRGIYDKKLKISLSGEQKETLKKYIEKVSDLVSELKEKKSSLIEEYNSVNEEKSALEEEILSLELLLEKLVNAEDESVLTMEDLDAIKLISDNKSVSANVRKNALVKFIEYNNDRKEGKPKEHKVNMEEIEACFSEYNLNMKSTIKKFYEEVATNASVKKIKEILSYMNSVSILNKFTNADLLAICIYGNVDSVRETYEEISKYPDSDLFFSIASVWVDNVSSRKIRKKKYYGQEQRETPKHSLHMAAHLISKEEINKNIAFLQKEGFSFDPEDIGSRKAITTDYYRLVESVNAVKTYGLVNEDNIENFKIWILSEPQLLEKLDRFVEIGLLGGYNGPEEYNNYLKRYSAKIHNIDYPVYLMMYYIKQTYPNESYYDTISSPRRGQLSGGLNSGRLGDVLETPYQIEEYKKSHFVDYTNYIRNYDLYEERIDTNYNVGIDEDIFKLSEIESLEKNNTIKGNPYVYVFDGLVISRIKVLRNYSLIHDGELDSLMASIVKGSFLTEESINKIAQTINYTLGGNDGLSRKVQP